jgi:hypothetical protein
MWIFTISLTIGKGHLSVAVFSVAVVIVVGWVIYGIVAIARGNPEP